MRLKELVFIGLLLFVYSLVNAQNDIKYRIVVAKDGTGDFTTIQDAVDATKAFPDKRITIFVRNGIYNEKVCVPAWNNLLSIIGEEAEKIIITFNDYFGKMGRGRNSTFFTYTMKIEADDFYAENLTIANSSGEVGQAVALHVEGNRCVFKNCRILGNQDTLYLAGENSHLLFANCYIEGTTDFIFGSATVVFTGCKIVSKKDSYISAAGTPQNNPFGFVFINCHLKAAEGVTKVYLGRPWREYARTVFINCLIEAHIRAEGWHNWNKPEAAKTAFYAEFSNSGPGSETSHRVFWSHLLSKKEAGKYTPHNILGNWVIPFLNN